MEIRLAPGFLFNFRTSTATMSVDWKWISGAVAVVGGAGLASLGLYCLKRRRATSPISFYGKSYKLSNPLFDYIRDHNVENKVLQELRSMSIQHSLGKMTSALEVGQILIFYCRALNARKVLDIGVFTGCSALSLALGLPDDGKVIACDISEEFTNLGKPYWERAGVKEKIDLRLKPAVTTLQELVDNGEAGSFDLMFIDADKENYVQYYKLGIELLRKGGFIVVDNALWHGKVINLSENDLKTATIRTLNKTMRDDPRVDYLLLNIADGVGIAQKL